MDGVQRSGQDGLFLTIRIMQIFRFIMVQIRLQNIVLNLVKSTNTSVLKKETTMIQSIILNIKVLNGIIHGRQLLPVVGMVIQEQKVDTRSLADIPKRRNMEPIT